MPSLDNWIDLPREILEQIYDKHGGSSAWEKEAENYFSSRLSNPDIWNSIVSLNETNLKDVKNGQLVRFRAMVQDQLGPEMYASGAILKNVETGSQKVVTGKFKDEIVLRSNEEVVTWNSTESRQCYYCVPIPGETSWIKQVYKRNLVHQFQSTKPQCENVGGKKRPFLDEGEDDSMEDLNKKACQSNGVNVFEAPVENLERILNLPLPSADSVASIVKVYSEEEIVLNSVIEIVGIASFSTPLSCGMETEEKEEFQPPSSVVPRIHCIMSSKWLHNNPHLSRTSTGWKEESTAIVEEAVSIRDELYGLFTEFFMGDTLAADYLLCHMVSHVYCRKDALALGKLSLNLTNVPAASVSGNYTQSLYELVQTLVTKAHYLPMSLENMNTLNLIPKKDYVENRLLSGQLQLSPHTHLVLDETAMTEGQLLAVGVKNVTALGTLTSWQKMEYDFNFHHVEFHTDIAVLILSERRSMISCDVHVPLRLTNTGGSNSSELVQRLEQNPELLTKMRKFLTVIKLLSFSLGDTMQEAVQKDFIQSRLPGKENPMSTEDFHLLLVLSRLLALTHGQSELTETVWQKAKAMEMERKTRL